MELQHLVLLIELLQEILHVSDRFLRGMFDLSNETGFPLGKKNQNRLGSRYVIWREFLTFLILSISNL